MTSRESPPVEILRGDRGAIAVEAAIVMPLILILLLGTLDAGLYLRDVAATTGAVRHGARIASAEPRQASMPADVAVAVGLATSAMAPETLGELWVFQADSAGFPLGGYGLDSCTVRCIRMMWSSSLRRFVWRAGSWPPTLMNACVGDPRAMSVGVALRVHHPMVFAGLLGSSSTREIVERAVMRFEPMPARSCGLGVT